MRQICGHLWVSCPSLQKLDVNPPQQNPTRLWSLHGKDCRPVVWRGRCPSFQLSLFPIICNMPYAFLSPYLLRWMSVGEYLWTGTGDYGMGRLEEDPSRIEHSLKRLPSGFAPLDPCWFINSRTSSGPKAIFDLMFASTLCESFAWDLTFAEI